MEEEKDKKNENFQEEENRYNEEFYNFKKSNTDEKSYKSTFEGARIPPHDLELEEVILGGILIDEKGIEEVVDIIKEEMFYSKVNRMIYKAIAGLFLDSMPIDISTVIDRLRVNGDLEAVGGEVVVIGLTQKTATSAHLKYHATILLQYYLKRELYRLSREINEGVFDDTKPVLSLLDETESKLYEINNQKVSKNALSAKEIIKKTLDELRKLAENEDDLTGVSSGFKDVDEITAGWQPSDLIIVAARPGMGKTGFTLSMARNISVINKVPVAFFSLEMNSEQLMKRLISSETGINYDLLRRANHLTAEHWNVLNKNLKELENAPLFIDDTSTISLFDLRAKARRLVYKEGVKIIFIDYLQLMETGGKNAGNREQEISSISRGLKGLAKELNIPIIALSQLSRNTEGRTSKRPQLSDIRESGAIEQDADIVTFLYRPEYYKIDVWDDAEQTPSANQAELMIAKHRNGETANVRLRFNKGMFSNLDGNASEGVSGLLSSSYNSKKTGGFQENTVGDIPVGSLQSSFDAPKNDTPFPDLDSGIPF